MTVIFTTISNHKDGISYKRSASLLRVEGRELKEATDYVYWNTCLHRALPTILKGINREPDEILVYLQNKRN